MKKVIHLVPYDGTGGVEVAARSMRGIVATDIDFSVQFIYSHVPGYGERKVTFGPGPLLDSSRRIREQRADLLIVSLWRACIVGMLTKLLQPRVRLVLMLHSTRDAHWLDRVVTSIASRMADEWWGDSPATVNERLSDSTRKPRRVISFVTRRLQPLASAALKPAFVFWGRISTIKGIDRALSIFALILQRCQGARFTIIGPDGGALQEVRALASRLGVDEAVVFQGEMQMDQIRETAASSTFYLQASHYEGMAMSVVEAMQLGLVPVVTAVGEIRNYCEHGRNGILITSNEAAAADILEVLANPDAHRAMRDAAMQTWDGKTLYAESMLQACRAALI